ncbi:hypothetical protein HZB96_00210 [Candidatus Gottesmanbacteria bacterium]|nr:hypothetical protein [Candidatus Gottesmanbacteria bacterium]MBI5452941.1 hypothetical protein [Candidatus Gottesmanbacteria bacterium]
MQRALLPRIVGLLFIASNLAGCGIIEGGRVCRFGEYVLYKPTTNQELSSGLPETHGVVFVWTEDNLLKGRDRQGQFSPIEFDDKNPANLVFETPSGIESFTASMIPDDGAQVVYRCKEIK